MVAVGQELHIVSVDSLYGQNDSLNILAAEIPYSGSISLPIP
jgi:hypothetical protein